MKKLKVTQTFTIEVPFEQDHCARAGNALEILDVALRVALINRDDRLALIGIFVDCVNRTPEAIAAHKAYKAQADLQCQDAEVVDNEFDEEDDDDTAVKTSFTLDHVIHADSQIKDIGIDGSPEDNPFGEYEPKHIYKFLKRSGYVKHRKGQPKDLSTSWVVVGEGLTYGRNVVVANDEGETTQAEWYDDAIDELLLDMNLMIVQPE